MIIKRLETKDEIKGKGIGYALIKKASKRALHRESFITGRHRIQL